MTSQPPMYSSLSTMATIKCYKSNMMIYNFDQTTVLLCIEMTSYIYEAALMSLFEPMELTDDVQYLI